MHSEAILDGILTDLGFYDPTKKVEILEVFTERTPCVEQGCVNIVNEWIDTNGKGFPVYSLIEAGTHGLVKAYEDLAISASKLRRLFNLATLQFPTIIM